MTSPEKKVLKIKICCACNKEKEIKSFYVNKIYKDGYENRCKICRNKKIRCRKPSTKNKRIAQHKNAPQLWNVNKQDWVDTYKFLETIGYDLSQNIHEQFCSKHNLPTKKRTYEKSIIYSPQDLDLV